MHTRQGISPWARRSSPHLIVKEPLNQLTQSHRKELRTLPVASQFLPTAASIVCDALSEHPIVTSNITYEFSLVNAFLASFVFRRSVDKETHASSSGRLASLYMLSNSSLKAYARTNSSKRELGIVPEAAHLIHDFLLCGSIGQQTFHQLTLPPSILKLKPRLFEFR